MADAEVNWSEYFQLIRTVCPWSNTAWKYSLIDFQPWKNSVLDLQHYAARVYVYPTKPRQLKKTTNRLNEKYHQYEWLWSHPDYQHYSTPIAVLIQQDRTQLETIRNNLNKIVLDK